MRFRFSIRDLLWLTLVVGLIVGWGLEHWHTEKIRSDYSRAVEVAKSLAKENRDLRDYAHEVAQKMMVLYGQLDKQRDPDAVPRGPATF